MAINYSPKIVTSGLTHLFDVASPKSYTSGSLIISNVINPAYSGGLWNSSSYSPSYFGNLLFNGSSQYIYSSPQTLFATNSFTLEVWCMPSTTITVNAESNSGTSGLSGQRYIIKPENYGNGSDAAGAGISLGTNGLSVYEHSNGMITPILSVSTTISGTNPSHIVVAYNNKTPKAYVNGTLVRTGLTSARTEVHYRHNWIGRGDYGYFSGSFSLFRFYNRALSEEEIQQNYNANKGRFGW